MSTRTSARVVNRTARSQRRGGTNSRACAGLRGTAGSRWTAHARSYLPQPGRHNAKGLSAVVQRGYLTRADGVRFRFSPDRRPFSHSSSRDRPGYSLLSLGHCPARERSECKRPGPARRFRRTQARRPLCTANVDPRVLGWVDGLRSEWKHALRGDDGRRASARCDCRRDRHLSRRLLLDSRKREMDVPVVESRHFG